MKYLTKEYWKYFHTDMDLNKRRHGEKFEELIEEILILEYGKDVWKRTQKTHDGKKDFYIYNAEHNIWAECKNYSSSISLNILAPTLIMAELNNTEEILFFSYSPINKNARIELSRYGEKNNKKIKLYDDEQLEKVILFHGKQLLPKYFIDFVYDSSYYFDSELEIYYHTKKDPLFNPLNYDEDTISKEEVTSMTYNDIFGIYFTFINTDMVPKNIEISFNLDSDDLENFLLLDNNLKNPSAIREYKIEKAIAKNSTYFLKLLFKVIVHKEFLKIPGVEIRYHDKDNNLIKKEFSFNQFKCLWIGKTKLIGSHYEEILKNLELHVLGNNHLSGLCLYGSSGTGKTRLLQEALSILVKHDYNIINFIGVENDHTYSILREIIYVLYEIPNSTIIDTIDNIVSNFDNSQEDYTSEIIKAYSLIRKIKSNLCEQDLIKIIDDYFDIIYEKLSRYKYGIVIDNIQYLDSAFIYFLNKYIKYSKNQNRYNKSVIICAFNIDFIIPDSNSSELLSLFKDLNNNPILKILTYQLNGFNTENQGIIFLKELLNVKDDRMDVTFSKILEKSSLNPFLIDQVVKYLNEQNIIRYKNNSFYISDSRAFFSTIDNLPENAFALIDRRWKYYLEIENFSESECLLILSTIFLFGDIGRDIISQIGCKNACIESLIKYNFIRKSTSYKGLRLVFYHDLIEKYFNEKYFNFINISVDYINSRNNIVCYIRNSYIVQYNLCNMVQSVNKTIQSDINELQSIILNSFHISIPFKLQNVYYEYLLETLLNNEQIFKMNNKRIEYFRRIGENIRDTFGSERAENAYQKIYNVLQRNSWESMKNFTDYYSLLARYSHLLFHSGKSNDAIKIYLNLLSYLVNDDVLEKHVRLDKLSKERFIAEIYNRLHVFHRSFDDKYNDDKQREYWEKSLEISQRLNDPLLLYLNYSDYGYVYYGDKKNKDMILKYWKEACSIYEKYNLEEKTLNYYRKKIQVNLIEHNLEEVFNYIDMGLEYIENGQYAYEKLYFKTYFLIIKTLALLIENPHKNLTGVTRILGIAEEHEALLNNGRMYIINHLKAKVAFYARDVKNTYNYFKVSYEYLSKRNKKNKNCHMQLLLEDMANSLKLLGWDLIESDFAFFHNPKHKQIVMDVLKMSDEEFNPYYLNYTAASIICSLDEKNNFPVL